MEDTNSPASFNLPKQSYKPPQVRENGIIDQHACPDSHTKQAVVLTLPTAQWIWHKHPEPGVCGAARLTLGTGME